jgi:hypothetical protein
MFFVNHGTNIDTHIHGHIHTSYPNVYTLWKIDPVDLDIDKITTIVSLLITCCLSRKMRASTSSLEIKIRWIYFTIENLESKLNPPYNNLYGCMSLVQQIVKHICHAVYFLPPWQVILSVLCMLPSFFFPSSHLGPIYVVFPFVSSIVRLFKHHLEYYNE